MRSSVVPFLGVLILLGGCAEDPVTNEYDLAGTVTDATTGAGIGGARVRFVSDTLYSRSTTTSSNGNYEMRVESDTPFGQVRAERDGYQPAESTVYFDTRVRRIDLVMRQVGAPPPDES